MNKSVRIIIYVVLVIAVAGILIAKQGKKDESSYEPTTSVVKPATMGAMPEDEPAVALPKLVEFGSDQCQPCKAMAPILEELRKEYRGKLAVEMVDLRKTPEATETYSIQIMPTQVFFDVDGKELYRHEGPILKDAILAKWNELGYSFE